MKYLFLIAAVALAGCDKASQGHADINPIATFRSGGSYRGEVFVYEGRKYILNYNGGILEIK